MNCRDVERRLSAYLDGELDGAAASALRGHLRICADCRRAADEQAALVDQLARLDPPEPPAPLWNGILERLGEAEVADAHRSRWWLAWHQLRRHALPSLAVAAAAVTLSIWVWKRGEGAEPTPAIAIAPAPAPTPSAPPFEPPPPATVPVDRDVLAELADDNRALDDAYRAAADDLLASATEERAAWRPALARAFDIRVAALRAAVDQAAPGERRERAWQGLIAYLQRAATGELVAGVTP